MPHINRIRVNNVKYNFGTQYYDDFVMRFSCQNTIYDLANGGGKSVLMLLLLQNLIPNCTLDEKQPVEKLFRTSSGSNTIHSLIEWKLDPCYRKDNYLYMTTGFCARKGRDNGEDDNKDTANIEYFNYCIFYREFGENDIKNLPLSENGEKITYNGLKSYLRDLEKKDKGVWVHIFERKGDYQNFISQYGLFESQWEIIRGINKTEGHVRTYFENNYKTGRKVVEDLLIEEIIQKSFLNQIGENTEDDGMAKTLLDIKDRIAILSKKKEEIHSYDTQISLMESLSEAVNTFSDYQVEKDSLKKELLEKLAISRKLLNTIEEDMNSSEDKINNLNENLICEDKLIMVAKTLDDAKELEKLTNLALEHDEKINALIAKETDLINKRKLRECLEILSDKKKYEGMKSEVVLAMDNSMRDNGELYAEIRKLAGCAKTEVDRILKEDNDALEIAKNNLDEATNEYARVVCQKEETDVRCAMETGEVNSLKAQCEEYEENIRLHIAKLSILLVEQAYEEESKLKELILSLNTKKKELLDNYNALASSIENKKAELAKASTEEVIISNSLDSLKGDSFQNERIKNRLQGLYSIYNEGNLERLSDSIYGMYKKSILDITDLELKINAKEQYLGNLNRGRYVLDGRQYTEIEEYLFNTYGEDVLYGYEWFETLSQSQQRDVMKRIPFVDYSFVVKGDFDRIREDVFLKNISNASYIVPIMSEAILRDTRHAASADYIVFGTKDLSFLKDPGKVMAEIDTISNELYGLNEDYRLLKNKQQTIWDDYLFVQNVIGRQAIYDSEKIQKFSSELSDIQSRKAALNDEIKSLVNSKEAGKNNLDELEAKISDVNERLADVESLIEINEKYKIIVEKKNEISERIRKDELLSKNYELAVKKSNGLLEDAKIKVVAVEERIKEIKNIWKNTFEQYYNSEEAPEESMASKVTTLNPAAASLEENLDFDSILVRFNGLVLAANSESADMTDKKTLIKAYEDNIEKCIRDISRRGFDVNEIESLYENEDSSITSEEIATLNRRLLDIEEELKMLRRENDALNAQKNRMEGSLSHQKRIIEERFGDYTEFECDDTARFVAEHTTLRNTIKEEIESLLADKKNKQKDLNEITIAHRDLVRMLKSQNVNISDNIIATYDVTLTDLAGYEDLQKRYDKLSRNEYRKKEEFVKEKRRIIDALKEADAYDLAEEVERSVLEPESLDEISLIRENIKETCECIVLEKDRVSKGIEDMERIKESFVNRCIQTCANIRSELDRLPKLSRITLDDEVISMIGLSVPYIKEEFYQEKMASYIDDTVSLSENFKTEEERVSYIRSRLSWKRLFSVIVTDMNGIKLSLYKRERIKDQSRYLRYEEAVGSTGQSQGIYIQFLIAIINYISSINAAGKEASAIGKVVFIDNPFGAAKDIYIWEPIFKLLKTNHVQLIVPARGATPAITARFDVNYILGQKMVGNKQQTVVVDYRSQIHSEEMEYTKLEFVQESLPLSLDE